MIFFFLSFVLFITEEYKQAQSKAEKQKRIYIYFKSLSHLFPHSKQIKLTENSNNVNRDGLSWTCG